MKRNRRPPKQISGISVVEVSGSKPIACGGEYWITLRPTDDTREELWEFGLMTGRILQTQTAKCND